MTVLEVIQRSADFLTRKGVETPRLQAELLLAHVLECPRLKLYLDFERALTEIELTRVRELVRRRGNREPLQYLVGTAAFCRLELKVTPAVLIPRPETELLAERGWKFLEQFASDQPAALDFGTGSGCLAIALAVECPRAQVTAVETSAEALEVARENAARHAVAERIRFVQADTIRALTAGPFDLVVANPPYVPTSQWATLEPEVRDHEPRLALDGGPDGLQVLRHLAACAAGCLRPAGRLMLEFGDGQAATTRALFEGAGWQIETVAEDLAGRPRHLIAAHPAETP